MVYLCAYPNQRGFGCRNVLAASRNKLEPRSALHAVVEASLAPRTQQVVRRISCEHQWLGPGLRSQRQSTVIVEILEDACSSQPRIKCRLRDVVGFLANPGKMVRNKMTGGSTMADVSRRSDRGIA